MLEESVQKRRSGIKIVLWAIIFVAIIFGIIFIGQVIFKKNKNTSVAVVDSSKYQAVFLSNGQTYFGKVNNPEAVYVSLSDVYYLVQSQPLQSQSDSQNNNQDQSKPEYTLVKLGKELHGPTSMSINKDQILFIENLANDSKVVTAINGQK